MNYTTFPLQKIPYSKKNKEWKESCVKYIANCANSDSFSDERVSRSDMKAHYDLYNSIYDENRLKYVTNPFKQEDGFPARPHNVNIIKPQVDLLLGEESSKPFYFTIIRTSDTITSELQDKMKDMLIDYMMNAIYSKMSEEDAIIFQDKLQTGEVQLPEQIQEYYTKSYKDVAESTATKTLRYLRHYLNLDRIFLDGLKHGISSSEEIYYIGNRNDMPYVEVVNPLSFSYGISPDMNYIHESSWCCRKLIMSHQELYDRYHDKLSNKQLNDILISLQAGTLNASKQGDNVKPIKSTNTDSYNNNNVSLINVFHACWQSYKEVIFVTLINEEGEMEEYQVDHSYHITGEEVSVEKEWAIETWEGYIADDIIFGVQPIDDQYISSDNLNAGRLPYTGIVYYNTNSKPKSFIGFLEELQYLHIMLWYRLELTFARDKGKVITMDVTQIPKSMDIDIAKWMHMLSALGINFVNPYDTGWDIPDREGGKPSSFNQFSSADLSLSNSIISYITILDKIENMAQSMTGITPSRMGAISSKDLVGTVERSIVQSSNITEHLFWRHNDVKREVMSMLLNTAKNIWSNRGPSSLHYILEDGERMFFDINEDFLYADFDIFVSNSSDEMSKLSKLQGLYQAAMQNGTSLSDVANIMSMNSVTEIKHKLKEIELERQEREEQMQKAQQEAELQMEELRRQVMEMQIEDNVAERDLKLYKIDQDNSTRLEVAQIGAYKFQENLDQNNNGIPDPIEIGNLALKQQDLDSKRFKDQSNVEIENKKIASKESIEKTKANNAKALQKQKDDAAMAREELKARTALKNKVTGEK